METMNFTDLRLTSEESVSDTYVTSVQNNKRHRVEINSDACKKSVKILSELHKKSVLKRAND